MRLFIGINLPKKQRARIHSAVRPLRDEELPVRWVEPDNFHITLKFLGEVRRDQLEAVEAALVKVASSTRSFVTVLGGFGAFPTIRRPRVIWMSVGANPELRCLKQDLEWSLGEVGFAAEGRSFHPHVTLGRADHAGGAGAFRGVDELMAGLTFDSELKVHTLDLMRSHISKNGTRYSVVSRARLAAS
jgi:2'-5' RNA ligase